MADDLAAENARLRARLAALEGPSIASSIVELVADTMRRTNNPLARQRLLDKVSRVLGDWPSGSLLNACKPHCERAIDAGLKHGGLPDDGAPTAVTRLGEPRRRVEMFGGELILIIVYGQLV